MNFKEWLLLSESIEVNFDAFIEDIKKYAQPNELELKTIQVDDNHKQLIIDALKKANQQKQEYVKYLLGFLKNKPNALPEDLDRSLDALTWAITTNKLTKKQIATDGWYNTGKNSNELIKQRDAEASQPSKRQEKRELKQGLADDLTPIIVSEPYKIYLFPKIKDTKVDEKEMKDFLETRPAKDRHKLLCKYGKDTGWCTASPTGTFHGNYAHKDIYIVHKNDKPIYQFTGCIKGVDKENDGHCQFMDTNDDPATQIPIELADLIMEKLPEIGKFYKAVKYTSNINKIKNFQDILTYFNIQNETELSADNIEDLLRYSYTVDQTQKMAEIIIQNKKELSVDDIRNLVSSASDANKPEIAKLIMQHKTEISANPRLTSLEIHILFDNVPWWLKQEIAKIIIQSKIELNSENIWSLFSRGIDKQEIAELIIQKKTELSTDDVRNILLNAIEKQKTAKLLDSKNISKLLYDDVRYLIDISKSSLRYDLAKIIDQYHTNKTPKIQEIIEPYLQNET